MRKLRVKAATFLMGLPLSVLSFNDDYLSIPERPEPTISDILNTICYISLNTLCK